MDSYFPKTRRPITSRSSSLKRPPPSVTPPKASKIPNTPTTPKDARLKRPLAPPPVRSKQQLISARRAEVIERQKPVSIRELFKSVHQPEEGEKEEEEKERKQDEDSSSILKVTPLDLKTPPQSPSKVTTGPLKGVSTSLLDIIRAKEAAAKAIDPEIERRKELLSLATSLVRIVTTVFTSSKREIISYDKIVDKCCKSLNSSHTSATIIDCLDLMEKVAPDWVSTVTITRGKFMRINKTNYTIPQLLQVISRYKKKLDHNNNNNNN